MTIDEMIEKTIGHEGNYSNHPADKGGPTKFGMTEAVARRNGYKGDMRDISRELVKQLYKSEYVVKPGFHLVAEVNSAIAFELFDTGVNMGDAWPRIWLQQCLNAFNDGGKHYPDIVEDSKIGPATIRSLKLFLAARGSKAESVMLKALNGLQCARYLDLARGRAANEAFVFGWLANRVGF